MKPLWLSLLLLAATGCSLMNAGPDEPPPKPRIKTEALHDVRAARKELLGKGHQEILQALGKPDRESGNKDWEWWVYEDRFRDPVTGQRLPVVTATFGEGKLTDLTF